jgi:ribosome-binding protein aMBF1 (putative translation factor)
MSNRVKKIAAFAAATLIVLSSAVTLSQSVRAESSTPSHTPDTRREQSPHQGRDGKFRTGGHFVLRETAKLLDMDLSELIKNLKAGKTLSALAMEKKGWNEDQYVQKLSEAASLRLDKAIAEGKLTEAEAQKLKAGLPIMLKQRIGQAGHFFEGKSAGKHSQHF